VVETTSDLANREDANKAIASGSGKEEKRSIIKESVNSCRRGMSGLKRAWKCRFLTEDKDDLRQKV
jgi:hypothetical protein